MTVEITAESGYYKNTREALSNKLSKSKQNRDIWKNIRKILWATEIHYWFKMKISKLAKFWIKHTAVFFLLFNFKMKIFPIFGHLCIVSDQELEIFSFWS